MNNKSNLTQKQIENRALTVTVFVNAIIAGAGVWMYFITDLKIMFLDGFFSLIALVSALTAVLISKISKRTTKYYPHGLYFLEPLYAVFKSTLLIGMMVYAVISSSQVAFDYFIHHKGTVMETAPIPLYSVAMTILCLGLAVFNRLQYKKTKYTSTILRAESQTNLIDGLQSAGIGVAVLILRFIPLDSALGFLHYTGDFFIATILVATSIKDPFVILFDSFRELTGAVTKDKSIVDAVEQATGLSSTDFMVYKTGMRIKVSIPITNLSQMDAQKRERAILTLRQYYENADIEYYLQQKR